MTYRNAKKLHNEDEVAIKETGCVLTVVNTTVNEKSVIIECEDGNVYHHKDVK